MSKPTNWTRVKNTGIRIVFNAEKRIEGVDDDGMPTVDHEYYPAKIEMYTVAISEDAGDRRVLASEYLGQGQPDKYTDKELYTKTQQAGFPPWFLTMLKDLYLRAINEDISQ